MSARLLLVGAVGFFEAARALQRIHEAGELHHWPAQTVNLAYAVELSTKAFLAHHGADEAVLRRVGHDLLDGLNRAVENGYRPPGQVEDVIAILSPLHREHSVRYLQGVVVDLPVPEVTLPVIHSHIQAVAAQIGVDNL